jgi:hypothetical protein
MVSNLSSCHEEEIWTEGSQSWDLLKVETKFSCRQRRRFR